MSGVCGIAGTFDLGGDPVDYAAIEGMVETLAHRGPDGEGVYVDRHCGLGHRRLAVIDLSEAAAQPFRSGDGRFCLTYNGELYNYRELRAELQAKGVPFRSASDTEVVLNSLVEWGTDALLKFNGMFAFAFWDAKHETLLLARDRFGVKPLYHAVFGHSFLFGSEVKAILSHPRARAGLDPVALAEYLTFQNFFGIRTLFDGVQSLPAGSYLEVTKRGVGSPIVWWDFDFEESSQFGSQREAAEELDRLFTQAVERQLVSDVPVGVYLSGGMDSGSIASVASRHIPGIKTFTVGFDMSSASGLELGSDERAEAEHLSYLIGSEHYEVVLKAGDMERAMEKLVWHLEEPRVGQSYPNFYAAKLASHFGKVVLAGTGGDELFAGYPWRYFRSAEPMDFDSYSIEHYRFWQRLMPPEALKKILRPVWHDVSDVSPMDTFRSVFRSPPAVLSQPEEFINHSLYFEAKTFLQGLLTVEDKLAMAYGLESRVPFLDNDLVDFALRVPIALKLHNIGPVSRIDENEPGLKEQTYFEQTSDGKLLLREVMRRHVSDEVADRKKQGFSGPDASWFRGESIDYVRRVLIDGDPVIYEFLDRDTSEILLTNHLKGIENRRLFVWSMLYLEHWCQTFL